MDQEALRRARRAAAERELSVSAFLAAELGSAANRQQAYEKAKASALACLDSPLQLGGRGIRDREVLHDRKGLR